MSYFNLISSLLLVISLSDSDCRKEKLHLYHNDAEIISIDKSTRPCNVNDPCNCPGGYFIHIDGVPEPHGKCIGCTSFKAMKLPEGFAINDATTFPVAVTIDWKYDLLNCDSSRIMITSIKRRN